MSFDRIITSTPINKTSAIIRDGRGEEDPYAKKAENKGFRFAPYLLEKDICRHAKKGRSRNNEFVDYTGIKLGRLTVLGIIDKKKSGLSLRESSGVRWSVKCICGSYSLFKTKTIRMALGNKPRTMCSRCEHNDWIARGAPIHGGDI